MMLLLLQYAVLRTERCDPCYLNTFDPTLMDAILLALLTTIHYLAINSAIHNDLFEEPQARRSVHFIQEHL